MIDVVGIGAGGHSVVMIEALQSDAKVTICGLLDADVARHGEKVLGVPVLGGDEQFARLKDLGVSHFFMGMVGAQFTSVRTRVYQQAIAADFFPVDVIHPAAIFSPTVEMGRGVSLLARAVVNARSVLGEDVTLNTAAIVEHDVFIGNHVHLAPASLVLGGARIEDGAFIGAGALVRQGVCVGAGAEVGAGSVVVEDVAPGARVKGVPAR